MAHSVQEIAEFVHAKLLGNGAIEISGMASLHSAKPGDLAFLENPKHLAGALASPASALIVGNFGLTTPTTKALLLCEHPRLAFARAASLIFGKSAARREIHPTAVVSEGAHIGPDVILGAHVVVENGVIIGKRTSIGANTVIGSGASIGADCTFAPNVTVYPGVRVGDRVVVHAGAVLGSDGFGFVRDPENGRHEKFPQIGGLEIGDDVEIGANTTIDRGALEVTVIGRGTKLDNLVHIAHNVHVGEDVVIAAQTGVSGSSMIEDTAIIAGQVGIADHVRIGKGAIMGAQSGIPSKKIIRGPGVVFWGTPARPIKQYLKELAVLARLAKGSSEPKL